MTAQLLQLAEYGVPGLLDVPEALRRLADSLEKDITDYGEGCVCRAAVVVRFSNSEPMVFGYGSLEGISQTYMDLHAGADELMSMKSPER